jgi:hypothetical protein
MTRLKRKELLRSARGFYFFLKKRKILLKCRKMLFKKPVFLDERGSSEKMKQVIQEEGVGP